jgi:hypothetical protein
VLAGEHKDFFRFAELFGDEEEHLYHAEKKKDFVRFEEQFGDEED